MDRVIDHLRHEHQTILTAVDKAEAMADSGALGATVSPASLQALRDFFTLYVHGLHQRKEDSTLFPWLRLKGVYEGAGCVGLLAAEHVDVAKAFPEDLSGAAWPAALQTYCSLLRNHIRREDDVIFPLVLRLGTPQDAKELLREFGAIDASATRAGLEDVLRAVDALAYAR